MEKPQLLTVAEPAHAARLSRIESDQPLTVNRTNLIHDHVARTSTKTT